jgi:hypothetical protein
MHFKNFTEFYNKPIRLNIDDDAAEMIKAFFQAHSLSEIRVRLWNMVEVCLTTDNDYFETGEERKNLMYFYCELELMIEAGFMISK